MTPRVPTAESTVEWTAFLRAKDERKANKLITRLQDRLDEPMDVRELASYEEDERLYQCVLITTLEEATPAEITYRVLTLAFQIPSGRSGGGGCRRDGRRTSPES